VIPGEIMPLEGTLVLNDGRPVTTIDVVNTGDRPIQIGCHFHFYEVNSALHFDRSHAYGQRLDIPSGTAVRFEPGERKSVTLVPYAGNRIAYGFNGRVNGKLR
jgi:urease subunit beta